MARTIEFTHYLTDNYTVEENILEFQDALSTGLVVTSPDATHDEVMKVMEPFYEIGI